MVSRASLALACVLVTGCRQLFGLDTPSLGDAAMPDAGSWQYRRQLILDGTQISGDLVGFPLLVTVELRGSVRGDAGDVRFADADGTTILDHEIERYDASSEALVAWVRVPRLAVGSDHTLFVYYGNPSATDPGRGALVWDDDHLGVWHLGDVDGDAAADSTSRGMDGTRTSPTQPRSAPGVVGRGAAFTGGGDAIVVAVVPELDVPQVTFETWINVRVNPPDFYRRIVEFPPSYGGRPVMTYPGVASPIVNQRALIVKADEDAQQTPTDSFAPDVWHHVVFQTSPLEVWIDGTSQPLIERPLLLLQENDDLVIGNRQPLLDRAVDGEMDEIRLSRVRRSAGWILTSYANQRPGSTFVVAGEVEQL